MAGKPSKETLAKLRQGIRRAEEYVDSLPPDERAAEIQRLARKAAERTLDPNVTNEQLLAELNGDD